jgi:hypothetical protein
VNIFLWASELIGYLVLAVTFIWIAGRAYSWLRNSIGKKPDD